MTTIEEAIAYCKEHNIGWDTSKELNDLIRDALRHARSIQIRNREALEMIAEMKDECLIARETGNFDEQRAWDNVRRAERHHEHLGKEIKEVRSTLNALFALTHLPEFHP